MPAFVETEDLIIRGGISSPESDLLKMRDSHRPSQNPPSRYTGLQHNSSRTIFDVMMSGGGGTEDEEEVGFSEYMQDQPAPFVAQQPMVKSETSGRSSYQRVQEQLMALNPHTPQSLSVNTCVRVPVRQFAHSLDEVRNLVLSRCEWLEVLKRQYYSIQGKQTRKALKGLVIQETPHLLKGVEAYREKCLSFGQILTLLENETEITWDDLMEEVMSLKPYTQPVFQNQDNTLDLRAQVKKTVLKDSSILLDFSEITSPVPVSTFTNLDDFIHQTACLSTLDYPQCKALSLSSTVFPMPIQLIFPNGLSRNLVILNISSISNNVERLMRDQYFPSLQFLNVADNQIEDLTKLVSGSRFPVLKELIACNNMIGALQRQQLPSTLKLLDLSYNRILELQSLLAMLPEGSNLVVLNISGNPISIKRDQTDLIQAYLPSLSHLITQSEAGLKSLSCFENFGDLAFKFTIKQTVLQKSLENIPKFSDTSRQLDFVGGCTISPALIKTPSTIFDLRQLTNKPTNRVLNFENDNQLTKQETLQSEQLMPNDPPQLPIKNDSQKYFHLPLPPQEKDTPRSKALNQLLSKSRPNSSICLTSKQGLSMQSSQANTARKGTAKVYTYSYPNHPYQQENQYVTPTSSILPFEAITNHHIQSAQQFDQASHGFSQQFFNLPLRSESNIGTSDGQYRKSGNLTPNELEVASYYEQRKHTMNLNEVRNMPSKQVCKVEGVLTQGGAKGSPIKAMMITQPQKVVLQSGGKIKGSNAKQQVSGKKENLQPKKEGLIKLQRVERSKSAMQSTDMLIKQGISLVQSIAKTRNKTPRSHDKHQNLSANRRTFPHQSDTSNSFLGSINEQGDSPARSKTQISVDSKRSGPERFGFNKSRSQKDSALDMRDLLIRTQQTSSDIINFGEPQIQEKKPILVLKHKEMTFNNNTNASNHNSARQQLPTHNQGQVKMNMRYDPYHPIPHHIQVLKNPPSSKDPFLNEDLLNSNSSNLTTPRFSERGGGGLNYLIYPSAYGLPQREQQYGEAMMLIKAQRMKNERRKSSLNMLKQPRNLKSAQGYSASTTQLKFGGSQAQSNSTTRKQSIVQTSQASSSTAAKSTMKVDLRRLKY
ncbi:hypothetical protein FGO68_gene12618 [Halteria grandinella]|uniref:Leucine-rich repeat-containing protein n=1 Tax=Halteria grandinella TaxID=5974 RepID=A0A8J8NHP7_HALGN|nr:hypothetical protein FGO68_gene12618 [Halteria grandinella]